MSDDMRKQAEELIAACDPYAFSQMIMSGSCSEIPDDELRELLARAFVTAAHNERQDGGEGNGSRLLDTMALDLRYNPGQLLLKDQIKIFYPHLLNPKS